MFVDCESPEPLRPDVKAGRSLRKGEQDQEHTQANYHHFDFNLSQAGICARPTTGILALPGISTLPCLRSVSAKQVTVSYFDPTVKIKGIRLDQKTRW
jgi:hypothetical protein